MSKTFRSYDPEQQLLLPAALQEWLPPDHLAYFISDVVDQLDLSAITSLYEREERGGPPYHPRMMVKVLLYGYCTGVASSRRIARRLREDIAFRVLAANNNPDFRTVSDFRKDHLAALADLFGQVLALCQRAGLVKLGHVALDGTKVKANASRNLFLTCEPLAGWRHVAVTQRRTMEDFAHQMRWLVDEAYPETPVVRVVMDNLNTHRPASLYETFPAPEARRIAKRLEFHYTPKHGSWLNMAEIEFSVLSCSCLKQ